MKVKKILAAALFIAAIAMFGPVSMINTAKAVTTVPQITRDLTVGSTGNDVKALQQFLNYSGYTVSVSGPGSAGSETSTFGGATKAALIKFQTAKGLSATGLLDSNTRAFMEKMAGRSTSTTTSTSSTSTGSTSTTTSTAEVTTLKSQVATLQSQIATLQSQVATLQSQVTTLLSSGTSSSDDSGDSDAPYISSIKISDGGEENYIDTSDTIAITFNEAIDPESINSDLAKGDNVTDVSYSKVGGVSVSSAGKVTVKGIATFDMGSVEDSGNFTVKLALNSTGKVLTITLTDGDELEITDEDFSSATQVGGSVEDSEGNEMEDDSSISDPSGTFGGSDSGSSSDSGDDDAPHVSSISVSDNGEEGYIDKDDTITITFSEAVDPESINNNLSKGDSVSDISYTKVGGVSVSSDGLLTVRRITTFDVGSVEGTENFTVKLAINSTGKILTITITGGSDLEITDEDFSDAAQIGGVVEDTNGNEMEEDSSIKDPSGTFGGSLEDSGDSDGPSISSISVSDNGEEGYIDVDDTIAITFSEAIDPESINNDLDEDSYITDVLSSETGGVSVSSAGKVTIKEIATFDMGSVEDSGDFDVKLALSSTGKVLTITLVNGDDIEISDEDFSDATQVGGTVEDSDGNEMDDDSSIDDPEGTFGG